jgi:integrase/recombinase XerD
MPEKYLHYWGNESSESLLEAYGLKPQKEDIDKLKPKQCPNCSESNKIDSKFCSKCRMVLTYDAYSEVKEEGESLNTRLDTLTSQVQTILAGMNTMDQKSKNKLAKSFIESGVFR